MDLRDGQTSPEPDQRGSLSTPHQLKLPKWPSPLFFKKSLKISICNHIHALVRLVGYQSLGQGQGSHEVAGENHHNAQKWVPRKEPLVTHTNDREIENYLIFLHRTNASSFQLEHLAL